MSYFGLVSGSKNLGIRDPLAMLSALFRPIKIGRRVVQHRIVHAPTSRSRLVEFLPSNLMLEYYETRAAGSKAGLIVFESTLVSPRSGLVPWKCGVWSDAQCKALGRITNAMHRHGSVVALQLFAPGRTSLMLMVQNHGAGFVAPSKVYVSEQQRQRALERGIELEELSLEAIDSIQQDFVTGAVNAVDKAGFDVVELHCTSGFLFEQFLSPLTNLRTDRYGGSVANRARFLLETLDKVAARIGSDRVAIRIAPWSTHNGMNYPTVPCAEHPAYQFCQYILGQLERRKKNGAEIAYVLIVEPRVLGLGDAAPVLDHSNDNLLKTWLGVVVRAGGYATNYTDLEKVPSTQVRVVNGKPLHYENLHQDLDDRTLIAFSRPFTSNPDLVDRLRNDWPLEPYDRTTFYSHTWHGYLGWPKFGDEPTKRDIEIRPIEI